MEDTGTLFMCSLSCPPLTIIFHHTMSPVAYLSIELYKAAVPSHADMPQVRVGLSAILPLPLTASLITGEPYLTQVLGTS